MAIVAVMMVVGFSAFKLTDVRSDEIVVKMNDDPVLWRFIGSGPGDVTEPSAYIKKDDNDDDCDLGEEIICEILAPEGNPNEPDLDQHLDPNNTNTPTYAQLIDEAMDEKETNAVVLAFRYE